MGQTKRLFEEYIANLKKGIATRDMLPEEVAALFQSLIQERFEDQREYCEKEPANYPGDFYRASVARKLQRELTNIVSNQTPLVYLSSPYTHRNVATMEARYRTMVSVLATYLANGIRAFSPIVHCHEAARDQSMPVDADYWEDYNTRMLLACDQLHVIQLEGWGESKGVHYELVAASILRMPTQYVNPEAIFQGCKHTNKSPVFLGIDWSVNFPKKSEHIEDVGASAVERMAVVNTMGAKVPVDTCPICDPPTAEAQEKPDLGGNAVHIKSRLVSFLYQLLRDHLPTGVVEGIVRDCNEPDVLYTNGHLALYAQDIAKRLETK